MVSFLAAQRGFCYGNLPLFLLTLITFSANQGTPSSVFSTETLKLARTSAPEVSGLSLFIQPLNQTNYIYIHYPNSRLNEYPDRTSYRATAIIEFHCIHQTRRVVVNGNSEWSFHREISVLANYSNGTTVTLPIHDVQFNSNDETLVINMLSNLELDVNYTLYIWLAQRVIDSDDRFGIQAFYSTSELTGQVSITVGLSPMPRALRRFVPCFDDPAYKIPYVWRLVLYNGEYSTSVGLMNGERLVSQHNCPSNQANYNSLYEFSMPKMSVGATQLRVAPLEWYQDENVPPPIECH